MPILLPKKAKINPGSYEVADMEYIGMELQGQGGPLRYLLFVLECFAEKEDEEEVVDYEGWGVLIPTQLMALIRHHHPALHILRPYGCLVIESADLCDGGEERWDQILVGPVRDGEVITYNLALGEPPSIEHKPPLKVWTLEELLAEEGEEGEDETD